MSRTGFGNMMRRARVMTLLELHFVTVIPLRPSNCPALQLLDNGRSGALETQGGGGSGSPPKCTHKNLLRLPLLTNSQTQKRDTLVGLEKQYQAEWSETGVFQLDAPTASEVPYAKTHEELHEAHPKFFGIFAYPYMNGE